MDPGYRKVTAIVRLDQLQHVERALQQVDVPGVSVSRVKGYGEYVDYYSRDWMDQHARVEIVTSAARAAEVVTAILAAASTGTRGDGLVTVAPLESVWRIRTRTCPDVAEL